MRSQSGFLAEYRRTHRNPVNVRVHLICVPVIFFASVGLLWTIPVGRWLGASAAADWVNGATIVATALLIFYARLSAKACLTMAALFVLCAAGILGLRALAVPIAPVCAAIWIVAWLGQFYGHWREGAKPAFLDDLVFLWIGPLFVLQELGLFAEPARR